MKHKRYDNLQRGAVSLFIIVFTTLLITVVTVSFVRVMLSDQQQATTSDLSESAYDSAQAGVEDAKRALLFYESECSTGDVARCNTARAYLDSLECNDALSGVFQYSTANQEILVRQDAGDEALQQAYTCVKVILNTIDYIGTVNQDANKLIPLYSVSDFDTVHIEWFSAKDLSSTSTAVDVPNAGLGTPLLGQSTWTSAAIPNKPPVIRTQLIQFSKNNGFALSDFDGGSNAVGISNTNTLFLYPSNAVDPGKSYAANTRLVPSINPTLVHCDASLSSGGYACSATISLPNAINGGTREAYMYISALYKKANYRVTLTNGNTPVEFNGVQPQIDSTGRANDLFRRVQSRVEVLDGVYPGAAVDLSGSFCKDFLITDALSDYSANAACTP